MNSRQDRARSVRYSAADVAYNRIHPQHVSSGDEQRYRRNKMTDGVSENVPSLIHSFTKGFQHDVNGFIEEPDDFEEFIRASDSGDIDIIAALNLAERPLSWLCNIANTAKPGVQRQEAGKVWVQDKHLKLRVTIRRLWLFLLRQNSGAMN